MEKTEKKIAEVVRVVCVTECADHRQKFEKGERYSLPVDHPCMEYFERVHFTDDPSKLGPGNIEMKKGGSDG